MTEEYRLSVGIDASDAAKGAAEFDQHTEGMGASAERVIERISQLTDKLGQLVDAIDGTRMRQYTRDLDDVAEGHRKVTDEVDETTKMVEDYKAVIKSVMQDTRSSEQILEDYKNEWQGIRETVRESIDEHVEAMRVGGEATGHFSDTLALMAQEFAEAGDAVRTSQLFDLSDEFRELEQHISDVLQPGSEMLKQFEESAGYTAGEIKNLYNAFGSILAETTELQLQFKEGQISVEQYGISVEEVNGRIESLLPRLAELRSLLQVDTNAEDATKEIEDMMDKLGKTQQGLDEFTEAQTRATDAGSALNNAMTTLGVSAGKLGAYFLRAIGITGMGALFFKSTAGANQFSDALVRITNMANLSDVQVGRLSDSMHELSMEFGNSSTEETAATLSIMSRGFRDVADAVEILRQSNMLADATFSSVAQSAAALSQAMAAFELRASDAKDAAETLAVASGGSAEAMQQMAFMAGRLGAVMNQAGVSLKDYAVAVATLRQGGMENRRAIMGLTQVVGVLSDMTLDATMRFEKYGIEVSKARIESEGLAPVIQDIYTKTNGSKAAIKELTGSYQAATIIMALMRNNGELLAATLEDMANKSKRAAEMAELVENTFTKQLSNLGSRLLNQFKSLGGVLNESLVPVLKTLNLHVDTLFKSLVALASIGALLGALKLARIAMVGLSSSMAVARTEMLGLRMALYNYLNITTLAATKTSLMSLAATGAAKAVIGLATAFRALYTAMGGWIGVAITAISIFLSLKAHAEATKGSIINLREETDLYTASVENMAKGELTLERLKGIDALLEAKKKLRTAQDDLNEAEKTSFTSADAAKAYEDTVLKPKREGMERLKLEAEELTIRLRAVDSAFNKLDEGAGRTLRTMGELPAKIAAEAEAIRAADPFIKIREEMAKLDRLKEMVAGDKTMDPVKQTQTLKAIARQLEELNVQSAQLGMRRGAMEDYFRSIQAAASPAAAALQAYEDRVRDLRHAYDMGAIGETEYEDQLKQAAISYSDAARAAGLYAGELKTVETALNPAKAATDAYTESVVMAIKALAAGLDETKFNEFLRMAREEMEAGTRAAAEQAGSIRQLQAVYDPMVALELQREAALQRINALTRKAGESEDEYTAAKARAVAEINRQFDAQERLSALENDRLIRLAAKYDPLIANEVERTKALLEMQAELERYDVSAERRIQLETEFTEVINKQYDTAARQIKGNITLADAWKEAWRSAIERIDGSFAELWKSAFKSMNSFLDQLKDTVQQVLAEIAHAKITRPLIMNLGRMLLGEKKPGEILGGGTTGEVLARITGIGEKPMETIKGAAKATEIGVTAALTNLGLTPAMLTGQQGKESLLGSFESAMNTFGSGLSDGLVKVFDTVEKGADAIAEAMDSISTDGLAKGVQRAFGSSLEKYFPAAQQAIATASGGGIVTSGNGGLWGQLSSLPGIGKIVKGLSTLSATLTTFSSAFSGSLTGYLGGGWLSAGQMGAIAGSGAGAAGAGVIAGQIAGSGLYGFGSGAVTNLLLGQRGNSTRNMILSTAGGIIGNFILPGLGAIIGGALGSFTDNLLGGGKKTVDYGVRLGVDEGDLTTSSFKRVRKQKSFFRGSTSRVYESAWDDPVAQSLKEAFEEFTKQMEASAEALGVSAESLRTFSADYVQISTKGKSEEQLQEELAQAMMDLQGKQITHFLNATGALSSVFVRLMDTFKDATHYTEEYIVAFQQLSILQVAMKAIPSVEGQKMVDETNRSATERYLKMVEATQKLADEFDGSIEGITELTAAFIAQRQAAGELAAALITIGDAAKSMLEDTAISIRESLMEPEELYGYRTQRMDAMVAALKEETDPTRIQELVEGINSLVNSMYQSLDPSQQAQMAPGFLAFLEGIDDITQRQISEGLAALDQGALGLNEDIMTAIESFVNPMQESTANFVAAVNAFGGFANGLAQFLGQFVAGGGTSTQSTAVKTIQPIKGIGLREVNA